jgi:hypothetical protein
MHRILRGVTGLLAAAALSSADSAFGQTPSVLPADVSTIEGNSCTLTTT